MSIYESMEAILADHYNNTVSIQNRRPVYGGDINRSYCLQLSNGERCFVKVNTFKKMDMFLAEEHGLSSLRAAGVLGVPEVYGAGQDSPSGSSFLLMEYLDQGIRDKGYWEIFGRKLAALHRTDPGSCLPEGPIQEAYQRGTCPPYGFFENNYIGSTPQINSWTETFLDFYRDSRLLPQMQMAKKKLGPSLTRKLHDLIDHLDRFLIEPPFPSLLHGDLWSGNQVLGPDGKAWILDPAIYIGSFEADLAMTQLFGGFPARFYAAYQEINPIDSGYKDRQRLYDLYHILNHVNLFGGAYVREAAAILDYYC